MIAGRQQTASNKAKRSVAWALVAALLLGGLFLLIVGFWGMAGTIDCTRLGPNDCALALEISRTMGRKQSIFGLSLLFWGGAWAYLRIRPGSLWPS